MARIPSRRHSSSCSLSSRSRSPRRRNSPTGQKSNSVASRGGPVQRTQLSGDKQRPIRRSVEDRSQSSSFRNRNRGRKRNVSASPPNRARHPGLSGPREIYERNRRSPIRRPPLRGRSSSSPLPRRRQRSRSVSVSGSSVIRPKKRDPLSSSPVRNRAPPPTRSGIPPSGHPLPRMSSFNATRRSPRAGNNSSYKKRLPPNSPPRRPNRYRRRTSSSSRGGFVDRRGMLSSQSHSVSPSPRSTSRLGRNRKTNTPQRTVVSKPNQSISDMSISASLNGGAQSQPHVSPNHHGNGRGQLDKAVRVSPLNSASRPSSQLSYPRGVRGEEKSHQNRKNESGGFYSAPIESRRTRRSSSSGSRIRPIVNNPHTEKRRLSRPHTPSAENKKIRLCTDDTSYQETTIKDRDVGTPPSYCRLIDDASYADTNTHQQSERDSPLFPMTGKDDNDGAPGAQETTQHRRTSLQDNSGIYRSRTPDRHGRPGPPEQPPPLHVRSSPNDLGPAGRGRRPYGGVHDSPRSYNRNAIYSRRDRKTIVNRETTCPFLLRVFWRINEHHDLSDFAVRGKEPTSDELQIYTWMDASLRELVDLIKDVSPEARDRNARLRFRLIYPVRMNGTMMSAELGSVHSTRAGLDDRKTLTACSFCVGDYIDLAVILRPPVRLPTIPVSGDPNKLETTGDPTTASGDDGTGLCDMSESKDHVDGQATNLVQNNIVNSSITDETEEPETEQLEAENENRSCRKVVVQEDATLCESTNCEVAVDEVA